MYAHLKCAGIADIIVDRDLSPDSRTDLEGPSGSGKSTLLRSFLLLLTGREPDGGSPLLHGKVAAIEARTPSGGGLRRVLRRDEEGRMTANEAFTWDAEDGAWVKGKSETAWRAEVTARLNAAGLPGDRYTDPEIIRLVVSPDYWQVLARGPHGGKALVDLMLMGIGKDRALREIVALSPHFREGDQLDAKAAENARSEANRKRDRAQGALTQAQAARAALVPVEAPADGEVSQAREVLTAAEAWRARIAWEATRDKAADWDRQVEALGEKPEWSEQAEKQAQRDYSAALSKSTSADANYEAAQRERRRVQQDLQDWSREPAQLFTPPLAGHPPRPAESTCPQCGHAWSQEAGAVERWQAACADIDRRNQVAKDAREKAEAERLAKVAELTAALAAATEAEERARNLRGSAAESLAVLQAQRSDLAARSATASRWTMARAQLGDRPTVPPEVEAPDVRRPMPADEASASGIIARAVKASAQGEAIEAAQRQADERVSQAQKRLEDASAEADRLAHLLEAIRQAPAQLIPHLVQHLRAAGLPEDVTMQADGNGARIMWRGKPWQVLSRGELTYLSLSLRAALRRYLLGAEDTDEGPTYTADTWLPVVVDDATSWVSQEGWPEIEGPVWWLWTREGSK